MWGGGWAFNTERSHNDPLLHHVGHTTWWGFEVARWTSMESGSQGGGVRPPLLCRQTRTHTKEKGGKTTNLILKRKGSDKKEDDGWEDVLLRGGGKQASCHIFRGL